MNFCEIRKSYMKPSENKNGPEEKDFHLSNV